MSEKPYWQQRQEMKLKGGSKMTDSGKSEKGKTTEQESAEDQAPEQKKGKTTKKPKIKRVSKKRAKQLREYKPVRRKFLAENPICQLRLPGCTGGSEELHHAAGRENGRLLKIEDFKAACGHCHRIATEESKTAIAAGHSKTRLGKPDKK